MVLHSCILAWTITHKENVRSLQALFFWKPTNQMFPNNNNTVIHSLSMKERKKHSWDLYSCNSKGFLGSLFWDFGFGFNIDLWHTQGTRLYSKQIEKRLPKAENEQGGFNWSLGGLSIPVVLFFGLSRPIALLTSSSVVLEFKYWILLHISSHNVYRSIILARKQLSQSAGQPLTGNQIWFPIFIRKAVVLSSSTSSNSLLTQLFSIPKQLVLLVHRYSPNFAV